MMSRKTFATAKQHNCGLRRMLTLLPQSQEDMRTSADLIRGDFEAYIADVQEYFRCIDEERARAFIEAREVSEEYGRFIEAVE